MLQGCLACMVGPAIVLIARALCRPLLCVAAPWLPSIFNKAKLHGLGMLPDRVHHIPSMSTSDVFVHV